MKKISIVTPCYNSEKYIEKCINSIINQTYQNYEHIIVDGGSTDGTLDIIQKYVGKYNMTYISEKDDGMYDAINKGFALATGEIFAWLNSDDIYMPWTLDVVASSMDNFKINWCTASMSSYISDKDRFYFKTRTAGPKVYRRSFISKGYHDGRTLPFIQQESTFWTKSLWEQAGGLNSNYKFAGDFYLWKSFAKYEELYTLNTILAAFRKHTGQKTDNMLYYNNELPKISVLRSLVSKIGVYFIINNYFHINKKHLIQVEQIK